jgi:hypothetical protein
MDADPLTSSDRYRGRQKLAAANWRWGYCLNTHPSETLDELCQTLGGITSRVRAYLDPAKSLGVELRLGIPGIRELRSTRGRARLRHALEQSGTEAFAANGYPLAPFGGGFVKQNVYRPDWTEPARLESTLALAEALCDVIGTPRSEPLTISTIAGMFRERGHGPSVERTMIAALRQAAFGLSDIERRSRRLVVLCLEPEPFTTIETTAEAVAFYRRLTADPARELLQRHLALNLDCCHQAVLYESLDDVITTLAAAAVPIAKTHLSAALRLTAPNAVALQALAAYDEPRYLHQTFARSATGQIERYRDLDRFLANPGMPSEVRVHFHLPLHQSPAPPLASTADELGPALQALQRLTTCRQLVVETYTWPVLRERALVAEELALGLAREMAWLEHLAGVNLGD